MSEYTDAIALAHRILDRINADPDDDLAILSRQLIRATEAYEHVKGCLHSAEGRAQKAELALDELQRADEGGPSRG